MTNDDAVDPQRAAIEAELRDRLGHDRSATPSPSPLAGVGLMCLACRGLSSGDAHFCTRCGVRFNALVVARGDIEPKRGSAA
jgi:hypothetical protein